MKLDWNHLSDRLLVLIAAFVLAMLVMVSLLIYSKQHVLHEISMTETARDLQFKFNRLENLVFSLADRQQSVKYLRKEFVSVVNVLDAELKMLSDNMVIDKRHEQLNNRILSGEKIWERKIKPEMEQLFFSENINTKEIQVLNQLLASQGENYKAIANTYRNDVEEDMQGWLYIHGSLVVICVLLGLWIAVHIKSSFEYRLRLLKRAAIDMQENRYNTSFKVKGKDEFALLGRVFDNMRSSIVNKTHGLSAINKLAGFLAKTSNTEVIPSQVLHHVLRVIRADAAAMFTIRLDNGEVNHWKAEGLKESFQTEISEKHRQCIDEILKENSYVVCTTSTTMDPKWLGLMDETGMKSIGCFRLSNRDQSVGALFVYRKDTDIFDQDEAAQINTFGNLAASTIHNIALYESTLRLAQTDDLTGLANRRNFTVNLEQELKRAARNGKPFSICTLDIDFFKRVNDTYGHPAGDAVLCQLATLLQSNLREVDFLARFGGEEFMVIFPEIDGPEGKFAAERIRKLVEQEAFQLPDGKNISLTISAGVTCYPKCADNSKTMIARADQTLYMAKQQGRNQVALYSELLKSELEQNPKRISELLNEDFDHYHAINMAIELKSPHMHDHAEMVAGVAVAFAQQNKLLDDNHLEDLRRTCLLHDVGMIILPDLIDTDNNRSELEKVYDEHMIIGADLIERVDSLKQLSPAVRAHHEHYDGTGKPDGLKGEDIPLLARIIAIVDRFVTDLYDSLEVIDDTDIEQVSEKLADYGSTKYDPDLVCQFHNWVKENPGMINYSIIIPLKNMARAEKERKTGT